MTPRRAALAVCAVLTLFLLLAAMAAPPLVGLYHDDGIYVGGAVSLASGEGYLQPHLPGAPPQTKYPPLYSMLLVPMAWIAGTDPAAVGWYRLPGLACLIGVVWLLPGLLRRWGMEGRAPAVATALTILSPLVFQASFHVMSEAPFMLIVVALLRLWPKAEESPGTGVWLGLAGLAAASVLCRTIAITLGPALVWGAWQRRREWAAWLPVAGLGVATLGWMLYARSARPEPGAFGPLYDYYVGYGSWVQGPSGLFTVVAGNIAGLLSGVGLATTGIRELGAGAGVSLVAGLILGVPVVAGGWFARRDAGMALPLLFGAATISLVLLWPFPPERFLLPLTPVWLWCGWRLCNDLIEAEKIPATALKSCAAVCGGLSLLACLLGFPSRGGLPLLDHKLDAKGYAAAAQWIRANTPEGAVFVSDQDPWLWLATGRRCLPPGVSMPMQRYRGEPEQPELDRMWARAMAELERAGARYVAVSLDWSPEYQALWDRPLRMERRYTIVYGTPPTGVWIYDLQQPGPGPAAPPPK
ncbi:MAG: ArnT family glycosyltransferase [Planctomycetota bacterium]